MGTLTHHSLHPMSAFLTCILLCLCLFSLFLVASEANRKVGNEVSPAVRIFTDDLRRRIRLSRRRMKEEDDKEDDFMQFRRGRKIEKEDEEEGFKRDKRFFPLELGCLKGAVCCQLPTCRPYCSLCNSNGGLAAGVAKPGKTKIIILINDHLYHSKSTPDRGDFKSTHRLRKSTAYINHFFRN